MQKQGINNTFWINGQSEEIKIITIYRFVSLLIISLFFFTGSVNLPLIMKTFIIACIGIASIILNYLYEKNQRISKNIKLLVLMETIGNSILLIPTGGLSSPFVWYSINTILVSAVMLGSLYCWLNLFVYMVTSTCLVYVLFDNGVSMLSGLIGSESNLILSLILITAIVGLLAMYIKRLRMEGIKQAATNRQLNYANGKVRESINHIMELYQAVYMFSTLNDKEDMINTIMEYTEKLTKADTVFFYNCTDIEKKIIIKDSSMSKGTENALSSTIMESWTIIMNSSGPVAVDIEANRWLVAPIRSDCKVYGVLGIQVERDQFNANYIDYIDQLKFMSGLSSIVFEKFEMEQANERLVITEEQNRIANEIHDSVLQRLFSTSFGIYGLMKNAGNMAASELTEELNTIRDSIDNAMKELRTAIYSMSWNKGGTDNFVVDTMRFIEETRRLNGINLSFKFLGNSALLTLLQKKSLYRIICEGVGNAVRHGSSKHIEVMLHIQENAVVLKITDDGIGFDLQLAKQSKSGGLGIKNIEALAHYLKGKMCISSSIGKGTKIKLTFPLYTHLHREEKVV